MATALASSCGANTKAAVTEGAMADRDRRRERVEATLRVLDDNPRYVDELFASTRAHPQTLECFLGNTAASPHDPELAARVALVTD